MTKTTEYGVTTLRHDVKKEQTGTQEECLDTFNKFQEKHRINEVSQKTTSFNDHGETHYYFFKKVAGVCKHGKPVEAMYSEHVDTNNPHHKP